MDRNSAAIFFLPIFFLSSLDVAGTDFFFFLYVEHLWEKQSKAKKWVFHFAWKVLSFLIILIPSRQELQIHEPAAEKPLSFAHTPFTQEADRSIVPV